ncbi:hypothetical protein L873DRAFT_1802560 [Choiromyces venosus 120613-1]|uniref:Uncharacterized protein n=1 Tax=Choiromyces venosus 120613-1 TaxID=1336337 RepID=A0A3N4JUT2_9PEZI|nr:hypothetical protein L873DRAFT_1802560 [Choiromyces venosus 120613-1]
MSTAQNESAAISQIEQDRLLALSLSCRRSSRKTGDKRPYEGSSISQSVSEIEPVRAVKKQTVKKSTSGTAKPPVPGIGASPKNVHKVLKKKKGKPLKKTVTTSGEDSKSTLTPAATDESKPTAGKKSHEASQKPSSSLSAGQEFSIFDKVHTLQTRKSALSNSFLSSSENHPHGAILSLPTQSLSSKSLPQHIPSHRQTVENIVATIVHSYHTILLVRDPQHRPLIPVASLHYAEMASKSNLLQDKFISMRTKGPSYNAIDRALLPPPYPPCPLFFSRWMTARLFAFGHPALIAALRDVTTVDEVLTARNVYKAATGVGINTMPAYGNIRFNPDSVPSHITTLFAKGPVIANFVVLQEVMPTFAAMLNVIQAEKIPYYTKGSLLSWLLVCDFAEAGLVEPPTARDLANRLWIISTEGKGGKGSWRGLMKELENHEFTSVAEIEEFLVRVYSDVKGYLRTRLQELGGEYVFRPQGLWYSDIEHCLCKVIRSEKFS